MLRSEHAHFSLLWDGAASTSGVLQALAARARPPLSRGLPARHGLPHASIDAEGARALVEREEMSVATRGRAWIAEPFLAEWIRAEAE